MLVVTDSDDSVLKAPRIWMRAEQRRLLLASAVWTNERKIMSDPSDSGYEFDMLEAWFPKDVDSDEAYELWLAQQEE